MSQLQPPRPVKLVMSLIFREDQDLAAVLQAVDRQYGPLDFLSEPLVFDFTAYYEPEMGKKLRRKIAGLRPLVAPDRLVELKLWTNGLEGRFLNEQGGRRVNIDPGYLAAAKFILATGKDYSHRIYLREGVYGDLTLTFRGGRFAPLPWTYPDYASQPLIGILELLRKRYMWQLKEEGQRG